MTITESLSLSPLCNGCKPGSVPVTLFTCGSRAVPTSGAAVVFEGCTFVDTALEEVLGGGGQLFLQKVSVSSLQPQMPALVQEQPRSLELKRSEGG